MAEKKLLLKDVQKNSSKKRFNTIDAMGDIVDKEKLVMFTHKARNVVVVAAKDTGKSFPVDLYKIYAMERDPMASILTLMKYKTGSSTKGIRSMNKALGNLRQENFDLQQVYEPSTGFYYRLPRGKKGAKDLQTKLNSQFIQFGSFEDSDDLAGFVVSNLGYPALIHIEEPVLQGDSASVEEKDWDAANNTIIDTVHRHYRDYKLANEKKDYYHDPLPFKIITTMNDWDPEHPLSKRTELYHPQKKFLDWALGFEYSHLLNIWKDKIIGPDHVVMEIKAEIDERWEDIKESVLKNHTQWVYVEKNKMGVVIDTLFGRMQKFANPVARKDEETREKVYDEMYAALITGDTLGLAKAFGMGYDGTMGEEKRFNFKSFQPVDTDKKISEPGRRILGFSMGWDHDANRGPVGTPCTISAIPINVGSPMNPVVEYTDIRFMIHEQIELEGYGKGEMGVNTKFYHEQMIEVSKQMYKKYVGKRNLELGSFAVFDDDDGSYVSKMADALIEFGYQWVDALENKNGKIETGGFGVVSRDKMWEISVDLGSLLIDNANDKLVDWLKQVPFADTTTGEKKRSVKGKWGKRYKDISNSAEYAWWPFRFHMMQANTDDFINSYYK